MVFPMTSLRLPLGLLPVLFPAPRMQTENINMIGRGDMRVNGLEHVEDGVIPCFETDGESMDVYIACK